MPNTFQQQLADELPPHGQSSTDAGPPPDDVEAQQAEEHAEQLAAILDAQGELEAQAHHSAPACMHCAHAQGDEAHHDTVECRHSPPPPGSTLRTYTWPRVPKHGWCGQFLHPGG